MVFVANYRKGEKMNRLFLYLGIGLGLSALFFMFKSKKEEEIKKFERKFVVKKKGGGQKKHPLEDVISDRVITNVKENIRKYWKDSIAKIKANYGNIIKEKEQKYRVPKEIIISVIVHESGGNPKAIREEKHINDASRGLMQLLYKTAQYLGYKGKPEGLFEPEINIDLGTKYLSQLYDKYKNWAVAIGCYNAGNVNTAVKITGSYNWEDWLGRKDEISKKAPLFAKITIPYIEHIFASNGILRMIIDEK